MITTELPEWLQKETTNDYCLNCNRQVFKKPVYIINNKRTLKLCFCNDCWNEILEKIGMKINETRA